MDLLREVLDSEVVDPRQRKIGRVDGLERPRLRGALALKPETHS